MNFFGNEPAPAGPSPMFAAKTDLDMYTDLFNRMAKMCSKKCVTKFSDGELAVGEMTCVDRCVGKYMHAQEIIGVELKNFEESVKAQEAIKQSFQQS